MFFFCCIRRQAHIKSTLKVHFAYQRYLLTIKPQSSHICNRIRDLEQLIELFFPFLSLSTFFYCWIRVD